MVTRIGMRVPFACEDDDGLVDVSAVVKKRAIRCALSRICGSCGEPLSRPIAFFGPESEADDAQFAFPPMHLGCAREAATDRGLAEGGHHLGHAFSSGPWALVTTGGFDLIRPNRRGDPIWFSPNSVIESL